MLFVPLRVCVRVIHPHTHTHTHTHTAGLLTTEEGRKVMYVEGFAVPLTVVKSDGGFTYATSDLTALRHRVHEEKADWLVYVVDAGQGLHLNTVFKGGLKAGYCTAGTRIDHMAFGVVLGEDKKKFKTRSGDTVRLLDLLDEGLERSLATLMEKKRNEVRHGGWWGPWVCCSELVRLCAGLE